MTIASITEVVQSTLRPAIIFSWRNENVHASRERDARCSGQRPGKRRKMIMAKVNTVALLMQAKAEILKWYTQAGGI